MGTLNYILSMDAVTTLLRTCRMVVKAAALSIQATRYLRRSSPGVGVGSTNSITLASISSLRTFRDAQLPHSVVVDSDKRSSGRIKISIEW